MKEKLDEQNLKNLSDELRDKNEKISHLQEEVKSHMNSKVRKTVKNGCFLRIL